MPRRDNAGIRIGVARHAVFVDRGSHRAIIGHTDNVYPLSRLDRILKIASAAANGRRSVSLKDIEADAVLAGARRICNAVHPKHPFLLARAAFAEPVHKLLVGPRTLSVGESQRVGPHPSIDRPPPSVVHPKIPPTRYFPLIL